MGGCGLGALVVEEERVFRREHNAPVMHRDRDVFVDRRNGVRGLLHPLPVREETVLWRWSTSVEGSQPTKDF
jgi:hypothetical protein